MAIAFIAFVVGLITGIGTGAFGALLIVWLRTRPLAGERPALPMAERLLPPVQLAAPDRRADLSRALHPPRFTGLPLERGAFDGDIR